MERYRPQIQLEGFGEKGQKLIQKGSVLVIGAGGLGCSALQTLAAMGVGTLGIADDDYVSTSNLHRQLLYSPKDVGKKKCIVAKKKLQTQNPTIRIITHGRITSQNARFIFANYQIILDASDNFPTRYLTNDTCILLGLPFIAGAVEKYSGQVSTFNWQGSPTYRDLFPSPSLCQNCEEQGVLGVIPNLIGQLQALEVIKLLTGIGRPLCGTLLLYNGHTFKTITYTKSLSPSVMLISFSQLLQLKNYQLIDVRSLEEREKKHIGGLHMPNINTLPELDPSKPIVVYCQKGNRSLSVGYVIQEKRKVKAVYSLEGGIESIPSSFVDILPHA